MPRTSNPSALKRIRKVIAAIPVDSHGVKTADPEQISKTHKVHVQTVRRLLEQKGFLLRWLVLVQGDLDSASRLF